MTHWVRFIDGTGTAFGTLQDGLIQVCRGDMFGAHQALGETRQLADVTLLTPCVPGKFLALWNNFHAAAVKQGNAIPPEPLYFLKAPNSFAAHLSPIHPPARYDGKVIYEGELGIVIGQRTREADLTQAAAGIFGFTCVNDVTAIDIISRDPSFAQWTRAKSFDGFGVFGPAIATGLDPSQLVIRTRVNGRERQNYPASDMIFSPAAIVSKLSHELTLEPGDLIACGTSIGAGMLKPGTLVEIDIDGIGVLANTYQPQG